MVAAFAWISASLACAQAAPAPSPAASAQASFTVRLKDLAYVQGVRDNQLTGFGLVTGLAGKGDGAGSKLLQRVVANLVTSFGVQIAEADLRSRNCAVVMATADLPAFARPGDTIPVVVSSVDEATDLSGGVLLQTNLKAANGQVYAVAQGLVSETAVNGVATVGTIPAGAIVEQGVSAPIVTGGKVSIVLRNPDFIDASDAESAIAKAFPKAQVSAVDASVIEVGIPADKSGDPVGFIAALESLTISPDLSGKVVVNPRTGVVVVGANVRIGKVAVSYKDTRVAIGADITSPYYGLGQAKNPFVIADTATVDDLVKVLQDAGVSSDTIIEILKAIDRAGALYGKLVVM